MSYPSMRLLLAALLWCAFIASIAGGQLLRDEQVLRADAGGPYLDVDWDEDGTEKIDLDASNSIAGPGPERYISNYIWSYDISNVAGPESKSPKLSIRMESGLMTALRLTVVNDWNETASAETYAYVRAPRPEEKIAPNVTSITPEIGPPSGGFSVRIFGNCFHHNPLVYFGDNRAGFHVVSDKEILAISPAVDLANASTLVVNITVNSGYGNGTNSLEYTYDSNFDLPVNFTYGEIMERISDGSVVPFSRKFVTTVKVGPDGLYYMGSQEGVLYKFSLNYETLMVRSVCNSTRISPGRVVLGINFHPHEWITPRLYVSSNLLKWKDNKSGNWNNGRVEVWDSVPTEECMRFSHTAVSGLPVSNQLHGVEAIEFKNNGDMLVSVAGTTNAGVNRPGDELGNIPESPLSAAILIARLSLKQNFNGRVEYNDMENLYKNTVVIGNTGIQSVGVYASGLRNVFAMVRHSNGKVYALDNGPNVGSGWIATGCGDVIEDVHAEYIDKLLLIKEEAHYGHPNWNRGNIDARQCKYTRRNSTYNPDKNSTESYGIEQGSDIDLETQRPLIYLESNVNGVIEYTADRFAGKIRGDLLLSKFDWGANGTLFRATLSEDGESLVAAPEHFESVSALSFCMGPRGHLLLPKYSAGKTVLYTPVETAHEALRIIAVTPRRGPLGGGNSVHIYGNGFLFQGLKIYFNDTECASYRNIRENSVWCQVPPGIDNSQNFIDGIRGDQVVPVVAKIESGLVSKPNDYEYMTY